ncbi:hypothetical protein K474DRAFT_1635087 [Panus rudis PR-1116 ss-1]|nr:hypothetical protein K474DRAFT_1635087 [Panus rudis PR-1116 ss-1]
MEEPGWKKLKLSLEKPYRDDNGNPIPVLYDITPEGQQIFEERGDLTAKIGKNLHRIFLERGHDFFEKGIENSRIPSSEGDDVDADNEKEDTAAAQTMSPEELFRMRMEIIPQLHIALGEMSQARDLLSLLLQSTGSASQILTQSSQPPPPPPNNLPPGSLTATIVSKPPPIQSVQAFNAQLVIGSKDLALRKASNLFKTAADNMERGRTRSERYWVDALKMRRNNWSLIPAPLPPGSATGKGADKTSKDFLISYGLEESPAIFKRRAIARIPTLESNSAPLEFPLRQHIVLQVSILESTGGIKRTASNHIKLVNDDVIEESLRAAQSEVVQQEIFSLLIKEASNLPTASARVSERLIAIEAAQETELRLELVDRDSVHENSTNEDEDSAACEIIFAALHLLLLRAHSHSKMRRLGRVGVIRQQSGAQEPIPPLLQPIVDMLQYQSFCRRVRHEIEQMTKALHAAGIPTKSYFQTAGESGEQLVSLLQGNNAIRVGGQCLLRTDERHTMRFTFTSPSSLFAHLPHATLFIASITQLWQLLVDEITSCLLVRIREIGGELCEFVKGDWVMDTLTGRCLGRWEGHAMVFNVTFTEDRVLTCEASSIEKSNKGSGARSEIYSSMHPQGSLLDWVRQRIEDVLPRPMDVD